MKTLLDILETVAVFVGLCGLAFVLAVVVDHIGAGWTIIGLITVAVVHEQWKRVRCAR